MRKGCHTWNELDRWTSQALGRRRIIFIGFSLNGRKPYEISELPGKQL